VRTARDLIEEAKRRIDLVSCEEARRRLESEVHPPVLIDVREEYEYEISRLGGSVHVSRGVLEMVIEHDYPDRATPMLVYCARGERSALAAAALGELGYTSVASIEGGLHEWQEKGFPVVVPTEQRGPGSGI
jgi:rhodanese-related sulfurtransferase